MREGEYDGRRDMRDGGGMMQGGVWGKESMMEGGYE